MLVLFILPWAQRLLSVYWLSVYSVRESAMSILRFHESANSNVHQLFIACVCVETQPSRCTWLFISAHYIFGEIFILGKELLLKTISEPIQKAQNLLNVA